jgi:hypothetical protein
METPTSFDLNRAIQQWRENLAQSPAIRAENLDELETHLRDSVATLQARGLSADEAFLIATKRVGSGALLGKEFGKVNNVNVWVERCLWALVAMQIWSCFQSLFGALGFYVRQSKTFGISWSSGWEALVLIVLLSVVPIVICSAIFWRLLKTPESKIGRLGEWLSSQPLNLAAILFILNAAANLLYVNLVCYFYPQPDGMRWVQYIQFLPGSLCYAGLVFFLARKRLLRKV